MGSSAMICALIAASSTGASIRKAEIEKQGTVFNRLWNEDFEWHFDDLPTKGSVGKERVPYSGYIYLDKRGGTANVLRKYDIAVNRNRYLPATSWEYSDSPAVNHWYGHCNGWTAAAIRHAEPQRSVMFGGVEFTPADIKGLLAEAYVYNNHEVLAGQQSYLNPGTLHAILANWLGRGAHGVGMDADPSHEKWNYPVYAFASSFARHSPRRVQVRTNILYAKDSDDREHDTSPRISKQKSFHYMLELSQDGDIVGGYYFADSDRIDFFWVPLSPKQSADDGNERGNPHLDVSRVVAIWRKSVSQETRRKWLIVDPAKRDRSVEVSEPTKMLPRGIRIVPPSLQR